MSKIICTNVYEDQLNILRQAADKVIRIMDKVILNTPFWLSSGSDKMMFHKQI